MNDLDHWILIWRLHVCVNDWHWQALVCTLSISMFKYGGDDRLTSSLKKKINLFWHASINTVSICTEIQQGARGYHISTSTTLITTSTTNVNVMVLVCNFHSILRSTMATETSDSINLAYEFALRPQKFILSTFNLKGHMLCCTSVIMNWIRGSIWIGKAVMLWLIGIHASVSLLQIIKWQKFTHVFFLIKDKGDGL